VYLKGVKNKTGEKRKKGSHRRG